MKESENIMSIVRLENIKIRDDILQSQVLLKACGIFGISQKYVVDYKIIKKSIDARDKNDIFYNYSIIIVYAKEAFICLFLTKNIH